MGCEKNHPARTFLAAWLPNFQGIADRLQGSRAGIAEAHFGFTDGAVVEGLLDNAGTGIHNGTAADTPLLVFTVGDQFVDLPFCGTLPRRAALDQIPVLVCGASACAGLFASRTVNISK